MFPTPSFDWRITEAPIYLLLPRRPMIVKPAQRVIETAAASLSSGTMLQHSTYYSINS